MLITSTVITTQWYDLFFISPHSNIFQEGVHDILDVVLKCIGLQTENPVCKGIKTVTAINLYIRNLNTLREITLTYVNLAILCRLGDL